jgi:hypothetical protein
MKGPGWLSGPFHYGQLHPALAAAVDASGLSHQSKPVSMDGCITSALTDGSAVEVVGAVRGSHLACRVLSLGGRSMCELTKESNASAQVNRYRGERRSLIDPCEYTSSGT